MGLQGRTEIIVRLRVVRIDVQRDFAMRDRFVEASLLLQSRAQIDVSRGQFRLDLHGPLVFGDRFVESAELRIRKAEIIGDFRFVLGEVFCRLILFESFAVWYCSIASPKRPLSDIAIPTWR